MKVLDATFLIDYLDGVEATRDYYRTNGAEDEEWVVPVPAYAEVLVGEGNLPDGDLTGVQHDLAWCTTYGVDHGTAVVAGEIADEVSDEGPFLSGMDALIAAVGRELGAPIVSADSDLTHEATKAVVDIEEYRE